MASNKRSAGVLDDTAPNKRPRGDGELAAAGQTDAALFPSSSPSALLPSSAAAAVAAATAAAAAAESSSARPQLLDHSLLAKLHHTRQHAAQEELKDDSAAAAAAGVISPAGSKRGGRRAPGTTIEGPDGQQTAAEEDGADADMEMKEGEAAGGEEQQTAGDDSKQQQEQQPAADASSSSSSSSDGIPLLPSGSDLPAPPPPGIIVPIVNVKCNVPGCTSKFTTEKGLQRHQSKHNPDKKPSPQSAAAAATAPRQVASPQPASPRLTCAASAVPSVCEVCHNSFATKANLKVHNLIHTGQKPLSAKQPQRSSQQHSSALFPLHSLLCSPALLTSHSVCCPAACCRVSARARTSVLRARPVRRSSVSCQASRDTRRSTQERRSARPLPSPLSLTLRSPSLPIFASLTCAAPTAVRCLSAAVRVRALPQEVRTEGDAASARPVSHGGEATVRLAAQQSTLLLLPCSAPLLLTAACLCLVCVQQMRHVQSRLHAALDAAPAQEDSHWRAAIVRAQRNTSAPTTAESSCRPHPLTAELTECRCPSWLPWLLLSPASASCATSPTRSRRR